MIAIAHQTNRTPEAIAKEMGRDMKNTYAVSTRGGVAVIPVTGPLFRHANLLTAVCGATSYELLAQDFNKALNDPNISAILFDVDSPGGEVNGCSELADPCLCLRFLLLRCVLDRLSLRQDYGGRYGYPWFYRGCVHL